MRIRLAILLCLLFSLPGLAQEQFRLSQTQNWDKTAAPDPGTPGRARSRRSVAALAGWRGQGRPLLADAWIKKYPNNPLAVQAYLLRGDAKVAEGDEFKALVRLRVRHPHVPRHRRVQHGPGTRV